jgi:hypothetical protein
VKSEGKIEQRKKSSPKDPELFTTCSPTNVEGFQETKKVTRRAAWKIKFMLSKDTAFVAGGERSFCKIVAQAK